MTKIRILQLLILVQVFVMAGCMRTSSISLGNFHEVALPQPDSKEWSSLNYSSNEFEVNLVNGNLKIKKVEKVAKIAKCELKISGGTLIGINRGEWGGHLTYIPINTTRQAVEIKQGNIECIVSYKDKIYFLEGLAHDGYSGGAILELTATGSSFTYHKIVDFDDAPLTFTVYKICSSLLPAKTFTSCKTVKRNSFLRMHSGEDFILIQLPRLTKKMCF